MHVYQGTPTEVLEQMAKNLSEILTNAGVPPTGLHVLAMMHLVACTWYGRTKDTNGKMPDFKTMLAVFVKTATQSKWTDTEVDEFVEDFKRLVNDIGGMTYNSKDTPLPFLVPKTDIVH